MIPLGHNQYNLDCEETPVSSVKKLQGRKNKQTKKGEGGETYQLKEMRNISTTYKYGLYLDSDSNNL